MNGYDLFSRKIIGWSMSDNMRTETVVAVLLMGWRRHQALNYKTPNQVERE